MSGQGKRLMAMADGTGGHAFPGLAVMHHLVVQGWQVRWPGTADYMEVDLVPRHDIGTDFIRILGLRGKGIKALMVVPLRIFNAWHQARVVMKAHKPDVVLGMGGYISGPSGLTAWSLGIPVVLHEQDGIAGLTSKWSTKIATRVTQAFPDAFPGAKVVGNPVRINVLVLPLPQQRLARREGPARTLVVGGSQSAYILNQTTPQVAAKLGGSVIIQHQSGKGSQQPVGQVYAETEQLQHKVTEFIDDMAAAHAWADIVACRSSALTVSKITATGLPASFVPSQHKDHQQYWNALPLEKAGAVKIIEQPQLSVDTVANTLAGWSRETLLAMAEHVRAAPIPDAIERMTNEASRAARA